MANVITRATFHVTNSRGEPAKIVVERAGRTNQYTLTNVNGVVKTIDREEAKEFLSVLGEHPELFTITLVRDYCEV